MAKLRRTFIQGFTLVELSIVLVIIGLLVGAITEGMAIFKNQRRMSIITKATTLRVAYWQFKQKYGFSPGDFPSATIVWGRADGGTPVTGNCAAPSSDNANPSGTCNGNGDGSVALTGTENTRGWQQLKLGGFIADPMTGLGYPSSSTPGGNLPASPDYPKAYYSLGAFSNSYGTGGESPPGDYNDVIGYGTDAGSMPGGGAALSGIDAYNLDMKVDDGSPLTGQLRTSTMIFAGPTNCYTVTGGVASYRIAQKTNVCDFIFMNNNPNNH